jgi:hypothetical protein
MPRKHVTSPLPALKAVTQEFLGKIETVYSLRAWGSNI